MNNHEKDNQSIIDEIIESLNVEDKKKAKLTKRKSNSNKIKNIVNNEIEKVCRENQGNDEYVEKISVYKINKEDIKEEYDIIMDCDKSDYIIYQKRK